MKASARSRFPTAWAPAGLGISSRRTPRATLAFGLIVFAEAGLAAESLAGASLRPWPAQYKIRPHETLRLTPADVVGAGGIVYPNWTRCGVQGGIPEVKTFAAIEAYGGRANDAAEDAGALERACEAAGLGGGGAATLSEVDTWRYGRGFARLLRQPVVHPTPPAPTCPGGNCVAPAAPAATAGCPSGNCEATVPAA